ncbi:MAG: radical SAM/SPASM domain-containing protein, partial [bacterium]|nr:radical SAM/SPASM domain-containing protein [bacterium]
MIETCNFCNLRCPTCTTPHHKIDRPKAMMSLNDYKKIIDNIKRSVSVVLPWFSNEPLLVPDMGEMVKYAGQSGIYTVISTNAVLLTEQKARELIDAGLDEIILCLDGLSKESYEPFREGADFEKVLTNIKNFCRIKEEYGRYKPYVEMQFILTKLNQKELSEVKRLAKDLKVDRLRIKSLALSEYAYSKEESKKLSEKFLPDDLKYGDKIRYEKKGDHMEKKNKKKLCHIVISDIVVLADGRVAMCCFDIRGKYIYGNVMDKKLKDFWQLPENLHKRNIAKHRE